MTFDKTQIIYYNYLEFEIKFGDDTMDRVDESLKAFVGVKRTNEFLEKIVRTDVGRYDLNLNEFAVLELLYHKGDQPIQKIRDRILIASSSTTYVIDKLCSKNLVTRRQDTVDKRVSYAMITDEGNRLMDGIFPLHAEKIRRIFDSLDDDELAQFRSTLKKISAQSPEL